MADSPDAAKIVVFSIMVNPADSCTQVMAPLLDGHNELNWQANMVDAIEKKTANQHNEGKPLQQQSRNQTT